MTKKALYRYLYESYGTIQGVYDETGTVRVELNEIISYQRQGVNKDVVNHPSSSVMIWD